MSNSPSESADAAWWGLNILRGADDDASAGSGKCIGSAHDWHLVDDFELAIEQCGHGHPSSSFTAEWVADPSYQKRLLVELALEENELTSRGFFIDPLSCRAAPDPSRTASERGFLAPRRRWSAHDRWNVWPSSVVSSDLALLSKDFWQIEHLPVIDDIVWVRMRIYFAEKNAVREVLSVKDDLKRKKNTIDVGEKRQNEIFTGLCL